MSKNIFILFLLISFSSSSFAYYNLSSREDAYSRCDQYLHSNECGSNNYCINYGYHCDDYNNYSSPFFVAVTNTGGFAERFFYPKSSDCNNPDMDYNVDTGTCSLPVDCSDTSTVFYGSGLGATAQDFCSSSCLFSYRTFQSNGAKFQGTFNRTGAQCSGEDGIVLDPSPPSCDGTILDGVCFGSDLPDGCVKYHDKKVCLSETTDNCIVDSTGNTACYTDTKNCLNINGKIVCSDQSSENCITDSSGRSVCLSSDVKSSKTVTEKVTQIDPNTTKKTVTTNISSNVVNDNDITEISSTTVFIDPQTGDVTTSTAESKQSSDGSKTDKEGDSSASGGQDCDHPVVCQGDVIQCQRSKMQWNLFCSSLPDDLDSIVVGEASTGLNSSDFVDAPSNFSDVINGSFFTFDNGSDSCPEPYSIDLMNKSFSFSYEPFCEAASMLNPLVIFSGVLLSIYIVAHRR